MLQWEEGRMCLLGHISTYLISTGKNRRMGLNVERKRAGDKKLGVIDSG